MDELNNEESKVEEVKVEEVKVEETITEAPKNEKTKKEKKPFKFGVKFSNGYDKLQSNIPALVITCVSAFIIMGLAAVSIFFINIKGPEKVLVPNVEGKKLEDALIEMQVKELYPKISLRYSEVPGDEGTIISQAPEAGAIVRGYSRVNLVVSRGVIIDAVGDYIGKNLDEVQMNLQTLFAGQTRPLIVLANPEYVPDKDAAAGVILEQDPPAGTSISEPVTVHLIVSRGSTFENTHVPDLTGQSVNDLLQVIARSKLVFDITSRLPEEEEVPGTVVRQEEFEEEFVANYTRVAVEMAMPEDELNGNIYGIFTEQLSPYPYPVTMKLEAIPSEESAYTILNFVHPGGLVTIPYAVPRGTQLVLSVADRVVAKKTIN